MVTINIGNESLGQGLSKSTKKLLRLIIIVDIMGDSSNAHHLS